MVSNDLVHVILCLCEDANTPRAVQVAMLVRYEEWDQLVSLHADPALYLDADRFRRDNQVSEFLRKCDGLPTTFNKSEAALAEFWRCEKLNYVTNERLSRYLPYGYQADRDPLVDRVLQGARRLVREILGPLPRSLMPGRFGPGATYGDRGEFSTVPDKMSTTPTLTGSLVDLLGPWWETAWGRSVRDAYRSFEIVPGNRFTTVSKSSKTDRGIAIEPSLNVFHQLGVGRHIRDRLKSVVGLDLDYLQDFHRLAAADSSVTGDLATIDLSSASDTVSRHLVELLLPDEWHTLLCSLRSPKTLVKGRWVRLEKFSSMGNGFTFELETLIFLSLLHSTMALGGPNPIIGVNLSVFGDDILVPVESSSTCLSVLRFFGFSPNPRKTFVAGPFRESCGGDFFDGEPVRAHYLEEFPDEPQKVFSLLNGLNRAGFGPSGPSRAWNAALRLLPSPLRSLRGPARLGDSVIHDESHVGYTSFGGGAFEKGFDPRKGIGIRFFRAYVPAGYRRVSWKHFTPSVVFASALYGVGDGRLGVTPRNAVTGYRIGWLAG